MFPHLSGASGAEWGATQENTVSVLLVIACFCAEASLHCKCTVLKLLRWQPQLPSSSAYCRAVDNGLFTYMWLELWQGNIVCFGKELRSLSLKSRCLSSKAQLF